MWMHDNVLASSSFSRADSGVLAVMFSWWGDASAEGKAATNPVVQLQPALRDDHFIASEVMVFVAWFWAFFSPPSSRADRDRDGAAQVIADTRRRAWPLKGIEDDRPFGFPCSNADLCARAPR